MKRKIMIKTIIVALFLINLSFSIEFEKEPYKLTFNLLFLTGYQGSIEKVDEKRIKENTFYIPKTYLDIRATYKNLFVARVYLDVASRDWIGNDLYLGIKPIKTMEIRFGKFKQPLGYEIALPAQDAHFALPSLISHLRAPVSTRDLGIGFFYKTKLLEFNFNVVNGEGRKIEKDLNQQKDISGRMIMKPFEKSFIGTNFYYGTTGEEETCNIRLGAEFGYTKSPYNIIFECLYGKKNSEKINGLYLILGYQIRSIQPIFRFDIQEKPEENKGILLGVNYFIKDKNLRLTPNFGYYYNKKKTSIKMILQLQGYF